MSNIIKCQNCGNANYAESNFCRFCGTRFAETQAQRQPAYEQNPPRPYAWKTDEFQTKAETRNKQRTTQDGSYAPQSLTYSPPGYISSGYRCPNCMSQALPRTEKRISTAGWIVFAVLLVFFFPLFWIGLLIKEDVQICPGCNSKLN